MSTIVFFPEGAFGPTNNCVGIADVLRRRGHRIVFVIEESFAGTLEAKGFEEARMRLKPAPEVEEEPGQFWKDFIRDTAPQFRTPTVEQLETLILPIWQELCDGSRFVDERLTEIFGEVQPDAIVQDNVVAFRAVVASGAPWVRIMSCNPLEMADPMLPPKFSGYSKVNREEWAEFGTRYWTVIEPLWDEFDGTMFRGRDGAPALPPYEFIHQSPWLDLYVYPRELDYPRSVPLFPTWHRLESCVRTTDEPFELPSELRGGGGLIYLSLGSLGSADVELMRRLIDALARTDHRVIVSKGPQHAELELAGNMWGAEFVPQTSLLPMVDLVITHAGNNTVTECMHFGKPMIALPLFWDQYDNAERVHEVGYGLRLDPYRFIPEELWWSIDRLLSDGDLRAKMAGIASRLKAEPGTVKAADLIERLAAEKRPVVRLRD